MVHGSHFQCWGRAERLGYMQDWRQGRGVQHHAYGESERGSGSRRGGVRYLKLVAAEKDGEKERSATLSWRSLSTDDGWKFWLSGPRG